MAEVWSRTSAGYYQYTVPAGATRVFIEIWGAPGYDASGVKGGKGGYSNGQLEVTPGETLHVFTGSSYFNGDNWPQGANFGWNKGPGVTWGGGGGDSTGPNTNGYRGGGASFICRGTVDRAGIIALCGGGGAASYRSGTATGFKGGDGGGFNEDGREPEGLKYTSGAFLAQPGTQSAGGQGGGADNPYTTGEDGDAQGLGIGGRGTSATTGYAPASGGGGWHGGGGDGSFNNPAAGGSGYATEAVIGESKFYPSYPTVPANIGGALSGAVRITVLNRPPSKPVATAPANGALVDGTQPIRLSWTFSDPDAGDKQASAGIQWRKAGTTEWTGGVLQYNAIQYRDFPPGTFVDTIEWQVTVGDQNGAVSIASDIRTFTVDSTATPPVITYPVEDQRIYAQTDHIDWTVDDQKYVQMRFLGDDGAGSPDESDVLFLSGISPNAEQRTLDPAYFAPYNGLTIHIQVRVTNSLGVWSPWDSVRVQVRFTEPMLPVFTAVKDEQDQAIDIKITNPTNTDPNMPVVWYNDIYIDDGDGKGWVRKAHAIVNNGSWRYWTPRTMWNYERHIKVVAVGHNTATSEMIGPD